MPAWRILVCLRVWAVIFDSPPVTVEGRSLAPRSLLKPDAVGTQYRIAGTCAVPQVGAIHILTDINKYLQYQQILTTYCLNISCLLEYAILDIKFDMLNIQYYTTPTQYLDPNTK